MTWLIACAAQVSLIARNRAFSASLPPPGVSGASLASNVFFALLSVSLANAEATLGAPPECATPSRSTQSRHAVLTALDARGWGGEVADFSGHVPALVLRQDLSALPPATQVVALVVALLPVCCASIEA
jgi:hypothetical protein